MWAVNTRENYYTIWNAKESFLVSRTERMWNDDIRKNKGIKSIKRQQIKWFGHLMRIKSNKLPITAHNKKYMYIMYANPEDQENDT